MLRRRHLPELPDHPPRPHQRGAPLRCLSTAIFRVLRRLMASGHRASAPCRSRRCHGSTATANCCALTAATRPRCIDRAPSSTEGPITARSGPACLAAPGSAATRPAPAFARSDASPTRTSGGPRRPRMKYSTRCGGRRRGASAAMFTVTAGTPIGGSPVSSASIRLPATSDGSTLRPAFAWSKYACLSAFHP